ncbi:hypothetical protein RhiirA1_461749 [Rhizophagus irregularis]|uniref:Uncharacterized protein n=1 Tax=Rhizophagus irregularis TaxID=588596 RepID=A0A2N0RNR1_9GLOM|nr:hypothetical protein RhiirA1_461749 [Rhizophagus irregularis]
MANAQEYINQKYPTKEKRGEIKILRLERKDLEGHLDLSDFVNLEKLYCSENELVGIDLSLTHPEKMTYLDIGNNNFAPSDLSLFSKFINLKVLSIGADKEEKVKLNKYNRFYGSLEPLKSLKLNTLDIRATDINEGLEFLSDSLDSILCEPVRDDAKVKTIHELTKPYYNRLSNAFDIKKCKDYFITLLRRKITELEKESACLEKQLEEIKKLGEEELKILQAELTNIGENLQKEIKEKERVIKELETNLTREEKDNQKLKEYLEEEKHTLEKLKENLEEIQKNRDELQEEYRKFKEEQTKELNLINEQLQEAGKKIKELETKVLESESKKEELEEAKKKLVEDSEHWHGRVSSLEKDLKRAEEELKKKEKMLESLIDGTREKEDLQQKIKVDKVKMNAIKDEKDKAERELIITNNGLQEIEKQLDNLAIEVDSIMREKKSKILEKERLIRQKSWWEKKPITSALKVVGFGKWAERARKIDSLEEEIEDLSRDEESKKAQLEVIGKSEKIMKGIRIISIEEELADVNNKLADANETLADVNKKLADKNTNYQKLYEENESQKSQIENLLTYQKYAEISLQIKKEKSECKLSKPAQKALEELFNKVQDEQNELVKDVKEKSFEDWGLEEAEKKKINSFLDKYTELLKLENELIDKQQT